MAGESQIVKPFPAHLPREGGPCRASWPCSPSRLPAPLPEGLRATQELGFSPFDGPLCLCLTCDFELPLPALQVVLFWPKQPLLMRPSGVQGEIRMFPVDPPPPTPRSQSCSGQRSWRTSVSGSWAPLTKRFTRLPGKPTHMSSSPASPRATTPSWVSSETASCWGPRGPRAGLGSGGQEHSHGIGEDQTTTMAEWVRDDSVGTGETGPVQLRHKQAAGTGA